MARKTFMGVADVFFHPRNGNSLEYALTLKDSAFTITPNIRKMNIKTDYNQGIYLVKELGVEYKIELSLPMSEKAFDVFEKSGVYYGDLIIISRSRDLHFKFVDLQIEVKHNYNFKSTGLNMMQCTAVTPVGKTLDNPHVVPETIAFTTVPLVPMNIGNTFQLEWQITPQYAPSDVTFESSNPNVATVDENGLITYVSEGNADITVTTINLLTATTNTICMTHTNILEPVLFDGNYRAGYNTVQAVGALTPPTNNYDGTDFTVRHLFANTDGGMTFDLVDSGFFIPAGATLVFEMPEIGETYQEVVTEAGDVDVFIWENQAMADLVIDRANSGDYVVVNLTYILP